MKPLYIHEPMIPGKRDGRTHEIKNKAVQAADSV